MFLKYKNFKIFKKRITLEKNLVHVARVCTTRTHLHYTVHQKNEESYA